MKKVHKIGIIIAIICIMLGTISYAANNTSKSTSNKVNTENVPEKYQGDGLASLKVNELELMPTFDTTKYEYYVKYIGEDTRLTIDTTTTEPYLDVEVTGNKNLKEGENLITILVTDPDGENVATYQLKVEKSLVDEEEVAKKEAEAKRQEYMVKLSIGASALIIVFLIIMAIAKLARKKREEDESYFDDDINIVEEELPKALKSQGMAKRKIKGEGTNKGRRYK